MEATLQTPDQLQEEFMSFCRRAGQEFLNDEFTWEKFLLIREDSPGLDYTFSDALVKAGENLGQKIAETGMHEKRELAISGGRIQHMLNLQAALAQRCRSLYEIKEDGTGYKRVVSCPIEIPA